MSAPKMSEATARATLGVKPSATPDEIKKAWEKKQAQTPVAYHHEIEQAYEVLRTQAPLPYKLADPSRKPASLTSSPKQKALALILMLSEKDPDKLVLEDGAIRIKNTDVKISPEDFPEADPRRTVVLRHCQIIEKYQAQIREIELKMPKAEVFAPEATATDEEKENARTKANFDAAIAAATTAFTNSDKQGPYDFRDVFDVQPSAVKESFGTFHHETKDITDDLFGGPTVGRVMSGISALVAYNYAPADFTFVPSILLGVATGATTGLATNVIAAKVTPAALAVCAIAGGLAGNTLGRVFSAASKYINWNTPLQAGMIGGAAYTLYFAPDTMPFLSQSITHLSNMGENPATDIADQLIADTKDGPSQSRFVGKAAIAGMLGGAILAAGLVLTEFHQVSSNTIMTIMDREATSNSYVWNAGRTVYDFGKSFIQPKL